jgi:microcompartment protein CcmL/EutN
MAAVDRMEKSGDIRVLQCELNDALGVVTKIVGATASVQSAIEAGAAMAEPLGGQPIWSVIPRPDDRGWEAIQSPPTHNPLIQQDVVFFPNFETVSSIHPTAASATREAPMTSDHFALGFIETQGFTAVYEAIDTACKAGNVEVVGKEKLGGGYIAVVIKGDLSSVTAAIEAGRQKVEGLGKLIAAHVLARPSPTVLALLPKP